MSESPEPTLVWALLAAIAAMGTAIGVLYKKNNDQRDKTEEFLLSNNRDMQGLLEKTLAQFNEVEKQILKIGTQQADRLKDVFVAGQDKIITEMKQIIDKNKRGDG